MLTFMAILLLFVIFYMVYKVLLEAIEEREKRKRLEIEVFKKMPAHRRLLLHKNHYRIHLCQYLT